MRRLFWKTWGALWLMLVVTTLIAASVGLQLRGLQEQRALMERPWRVIDSLALEAERVIERGGDLSTWSRLPSVNSFGQVYVLDATGTDVAGRGLPDELADTTLQPFDMPDSEASESHEVVSGPGYTRQPLALARAIFSSDAEEPLTLILVPMPTSFSRVASLLWPPLMIIFGLVVTGVGAWLFSRHFTQPLKELESAGEAIRNGDYSRRPGRALGKRADELADFSRHFDLITEDLAKAADFQGALLRDVSHELRSPLTRMQVALDLLRTNPEQASSDLIAGIESELLGLESLIDGILVLSRLSGGSESLSLGHVDPGELILELESEPFLAESGREARVRIEPNGSSMRVDAKLLRRALSNVVRNAAKYSPAGTPILLRYECDPCWHVFSVQDCGPGVPDDELDAIFEPFYRSYFTESRPGHGVGLAIVKHVTEAHGGIVVAENHREGGFSVSLKLPVEHSADAVQDGRCPASTAAQRSISARTRAGQKES